MILVDSNIPMYLVGGAHPNKEEAHNLLQSMIRGGERLVTDAEVLQEILHRYASIKRLDAIQPAFEAILKVVDEVFPVDRKDVERAKEILLGSKEITARDSVHIAIMERREIEAILSFDQGFDEFPGIRRIPR